MVIFWEARGGEHTPRKSWVGNDDVSCVRCLHIKPFFLLNISTPSFRADSLS